MAAGWDCWPPAPRHRKPDGCAERRAVVERPAVPRPTGATGPDGRPFVVEEIGELDEPWAMTFLPDGQALITGRGGELTLRSADGQRLDVTGVPEVVHEGQGGLGDVIVAPDFASTRHVYLSWAEAGDGGSGAAVARATLTADGGRGETRRSDGHLAAAAEGVGQRSLRSPARVLPRW